MTRVLRPFQPGARAALSNPKAVHAPITVRVSDIVKQYLIADSGATAGQTVYSAPNARCHVISATATAWDANGRLIDNSIIQWSSADTSTLTIDAQGVMRAPQCWLDSLGRSDTTTRQAVITAFVRGARP